jgi:hypothetical protein
MYLAASGEVAPTKGLSPTFFLRSYVSLRSSEDMLAQPMDINNIIKTAARQINPFIVPPYHSDAETMFSVKRVPTNR